MATALSLSPLFRHSVGFDRFNDLFDTLATDTTQAKPSFPPYDILKKGDDNYHIVIAIAGYNESDIEITLENDRLKVAGKHENPAEDGTTYLHRGIAKRAFELSFRLADHMKVKDAGMVNGLLTIHIFREVPEAKKPQTIVINSKKED